MIELLHRPKDGLHWLAPTRPVMPRPFRLSAGWCLCIAAVLLSGACARLPGRPTDDTVQAPSPNFGERRPNYVILHQTTNDTAEEALATLTNPARAVSAHYLIGRDGQVYQLVSELHRAWHAGASYWGGNTDMNSASIGIELDNNGEEPFADAQIARLLRLLGELKARYRIPSANFLGHGDVAPGRKIDPGVRFPWRRLAAAGFGLWCEIPLDEGQGSDGQIADSLRVAEVNRGLQTLGYDVTDPAAALAAFRRHFWGIDAATAPDFNDLRMLNCLIAQKSMPARRSAADASSDAGRDGP